MAGDDSESTGGSGSAARHERQQANVDTSGASARRLHPGWAGNAALDRLTGFAARILAAPSSLITLGDGVAAVVGRTGMPPGPDALHEVPLVESLCALCGTGRRDVSIADVGADPRVQHVSSARDGIVGSFLGVPLTSDAVTRNVARCVDAASALDQVSHVRRGRPQRRCNVL